LDPNDDIHGRSNNLDELYREVGPRLLLFFQQRHADQHAAEDLLQETFSAVLRHPDGLRLAVSPQAYLFGIARNLSAEAFRRIRFVEVLPQEMSGEAPSSVDPRLEAMRDAIAKLDPAFREVVELRLQSELSYEEIAAVLEIPIGTVRSRLHHAVKHLRQALERKSPPHN
jgi:RNA polymerase sigma-70 factor (ECF subfamily)